MKKLAINKKACLGCGACVSIAPKVFKIGEDGKSEVVDQNGDSQETIQNAVDSCPVQAISWRE